ncbi:MAG: hypothetical protein LCH73_07130 [Proteobacteria bacterium]|nr:hypothetical protein [Pseudomonadota bacterium]
MDYHAMRMRHARSRLAAGLQRWGLWLLTFAALLVMGANDPLALLAGLPVALALPLFSAAAQGPWPLAGATLAYALAGVLPVWLTRPLWWPARWAEAERALPLPASVLRASDRRCLRWGWLPLQGLLALGAALLWALDPPGLHATRSLAVAALALAALAAAVLARALLRRWRAAAAPGHASDGPATLAQGVQAQHAQWALLLRPLWRGPARRSGRALALLLAAAPLPALALMGWPAHGGWWLAAQALLAMAGTAELQRRLHDELAPLWAACAALPLRTPPPRAARTLVCAPAALGVAATLAVLLGAHRPHPLPLAGWLLGMAVAIWRASSAPTARADHDAAWTLLVLALTFAFASQVMP